MEIEHMNMKRRLFLKGSFATTAIGIAVGSGLLAPRAVLAAWPKESFAAKSAADVVNGLYGSEKTEATDKIKIKAPDIAENGAVVPVKVYADDLGKVDNISLLVEKNGTPLVARFNMGDTATGYVSTRIKMGKTSDVIAVVRSNGKLYSARKNVKVTIGGCGG
jgi:sulfur-oxidizing protein SoxY